MNTATTWIGIGLLVVFVLPIIYAIIQSQRKVRAAIKELKSLSGEDNLSVTEIEIQPEYYLGLDPEAQTIVYVNRKKNNEWIQCDLSEMKEVQYLHHNEAAARKGEEPIGLRLVPLSGKSKDPAEIRLYTPGDSGGGHYSVHFYNAEKWKHLIGSVL